MPKAEIPTTQATFALEKLHAELAGKVAQNKKEGAVPLIVAAGPPRLF
jgi:hypothetical protein